MRSRLAAVLFLAATLTAPSFAQTQQQQTSSDIGSWLIFQAIPSLQVYSSPCRIPFAFEWEASPLLYSFGMNRLVSPWHSFFVLPPPRFTGSIEVKLTGEVFTRKLGRRTLAALRSSLATFHSWNTARTSASTSGSRSTGSPDRRRGLKSQDFRRYSVSWSSTSSTAPIPQSGWAPSSFAFFEGADPSLLR